LAKFVALDAAAAAEVKLPLVAPDGLTLLAKEMASEAS
jgi:hypothetical protein